MHTREPVSNARVLTDVLTNANLGCAAGQNGIPTAFIINGDGQVAWIGHPMGMDEPLAEIVDGTWDISVAATMHITLP